METSNINITVDVNETIQTQHHQTNEPIGATPVPVAHEAAKAQTNVDCDAKDTAETERPVDVLIEVVDDAAPIHSNNSTSNIESETKNQQQQLKQKDMESNKGTNSADDIEVHESMVSAVSDGSDSSVTHSIDGNEGDDENSNHNMNENNCDDEQKSEFILHKLSNYRGLCWNKNRQSWLVRIHCHGDRLYIGNFKDEIEAAMAFDKKARELFGKDAALNFPGEGERSAPKHKLPSRYIENKQEGKAEISCESNGNGASAICESNGYNFKQREPRAASYRLLRKTSSMNQGYSPLKHKRDLPESFQTEQTTTSKPIGIFENESPRKRKRENSRSSEDICLSDDTINSRSRRDSLIYTNGVSLSNTKISTTKTATSKFDSVTPTITKQSLGSLNTMHQTPLKFNPLLLTEAGKTIAVNEAKSNANALLNSFLNQSLTKGQLFQNGNASKLPSLPAFGNHLQLMGYQPSNNTNNISSTSNNNNINIGSNQAFQHQLLAQMNQSFAPTQYFPTQNFNGMNMGSQASMHPEQYIKSFVHPGFVQARMNSFPSVKPQERGVSMENFTNFNSFNPSSIDVKYPRLFF